MKKKFPVLLAFGVLFAGGCARFHPRPLSAASSATGFEERSLTNRSLRAFLETNHVAGEWPLPSWDLRDLTIAAFYYQPDLAVARAQLLTAQAARITAGQRPNPSIGVTPGFDSGIPGNPSPWLVPVSLDWPIETAGKRGKRIAEAEHLAEAARWSLIGTIWLVRSQVRTALLNLYAAEETESLLARQEAAESNVVRLLAGQFEAGSVSSFEVTQARVARDTTRLDWQAAMGQARQARALLASAVGVPLSAIESVKPSFAGLDQFPRNLTKPEVRREALLNRSDVRGALAQYAASQSALQLEIANQYPDIHLGPGYGWNAGSAGDSEWDLGLSLTLPILNQNQGPIAEANAKRAQAAAQFLSVQATAIGQIDSALAAYDAALGEAATAKSLLQSLSQRLDSVQAQEQAGEAAALDVANAQVAFDIGAQNRLTALIRAQQALGFLEDAVQSPLTLPPNAIQAAERGTVAAEGARPMKFEPK
jgi:outer membrane protein, heavy metal efflux system